MIVAVAGFEALPAASWATKVRCTTTSGPSEGSLGGVVIVNVHVDPEWLEPVTVTPGKSAEPPTAVTPTLSLAVTATVAVWGPHPA